MSFSSMAIFHQPVKKFGQAVFLLFFCTSLFACASQHLESVAIAIERADSTPVMIRAELAKTQEERNKGLMHRKQLADGRGMLFIFEREEMLSFWMKNTYIPLSIAFIAADGRIIEIKDMRPLDLSQVRSSRSVRYALEVPQGWFDRVDVKPGDVLNVGTVQKLRN